MQKTAFVRVYRGFSPLEFYVKLAICQLKLSVGRPLRSLRSLVDS